MTYAELLDFLAATSKRSDLTAVMPTFVQLADSRLNRDLRLRRQVVNTTLTTTAGAQSVTLPADWLETENLTVSASPPRPVQLVTPEQLDAKFPAGTFTGVPAFATIVGNSMQFGPTPDAAYGVSMDYYQRFDATAGNWVLTNHPGVYIAAAMAELCLYTMDERFVLWDAKYQAEQAALQEADDIGIRSGSALRVRSL